MISLKIKNISDEYNSLLEMIKNDSAFFLLEDKKQILKELLIKNDMPKRSFEQILTCFTKGEIEKHAKIPKLRNETHFIQESIIQESDTFPVPNVDSIMDYLNSVEQPDQRTPEWHDYRHGVVTASSASHIFGTDAERKRYIEEKVMPMKIFKAGTACLHGIKLEEVAQEIYERLTDTKVGEYGCIRHKTISHLGASPDGIVIESKDPKMLGRMLEIKCLYSRELTGVPLYKYWVQCQLQMEVCDLEFCDFFECKIDENLTKDDFYKTIENKNAEFYGMLIEYTSGDDDKILYKYACMNESVAYYKLWNEKVIDELIENDSVQIVKQTFWKLNKYCKTVIKRNRDWFKKVEPEIATFWKEVEKYRSIIKENPEKSSSLFPKKERKSYSPPQTTCMIIDDEDENKEEVDPFEIHSSI
jgi:putative phage-type endonuclease